MIRKTYPAWKPDHGRKRYPVVIVGGGAVGLTLALALAHRGVETLMLENDIGVCDGSRALGMARRTVDIWDYLGVGSRIAAEGVGWIGGRTFYRDKTVLEFRLPSDQAQCHPPLLNIQQSHVEQYLVDEILRHDAAEIGWACNFTGLETQADHVRLSVETAQGPVTLEADYVVACDGARSTVRNVCGLHMEGSSYAAEYVIVDVELKSRSPIERRAWFDPPWHPASTILMHGQPENIWRIDFQMSPGERPDDVLRPQVLSELVGRHLAAIGEPADFKIVWATSYRAHSRLLPNYRHGRILFAGDSAHLMPIFGIRGLNSGVEDAFNLSWKLDYVLRGRASDRLLDSYNEERRYATLQNMALANRAADFMTPSTRGRHAMRDAVLSLAVGEERVRPLVNPRQATFIPLYGSSLNSTFDSRDDNEIKPGDVLPNFRVGSDCLYRKLGGGFSLAMAAEGAAGRSEMIDDIARTCDLRLLRFGGQDRLRDPNGEIRRRLGLLDGTMLLVRPDHHIAARAGPEQMPAAWSRSMANHITDEPAR